MMHEFTIELVVSFLLHLSMELFNFGAPHLQQCI